MLPFNLPSKMRPKMQYKIKRVFSLLAEAENVRFVLDLEAFYNSAPVTFSSDVPAPAWLFADPFNGVVSDFESFLRFCYCVAFWRFDSVRELFTSKNASPRVYVDASYFDASGQLFEDEVLAPAFVCELVAVFFDVVALVREKYQSLELVAFYSLDSYNELTLDLSADAVEVNHD